MYAHRLSRQFAPILVLSMILFVSCAPAATPDPTQALVGTWTTSLTKEDILRVDPDFHQEALCDNSGTFVMTFNTDGTFTVDQTPLPECQGQTSGHLESKWSATGNLITLDKDTPDEGVYEFAINGDRLTLKSQSSNCPPCIAVNTANPWTRVE